MNAFMVDDLVAKGDPVDQIGPQVGTVEALRGVKLCELRLARNRRLERGHTKHLNRLTEHRQEFLEVTPVVRLELELNNLDWGHDAVYWHLEPSGSQYDFWAHDPA